MSLFMIRPRRIRRTGDDTPARSLLRYIWRMSGRHQIWICLLAVATASLTAIPLELQRRIVNEVVEDRDLNLLWWLAGIYLMVLLVQSLAKYALRMYQGWLGESAIRYNRAHLSRIHECHHTDGGNDDSGQAVSVIATEIDKLGGFVGESLSQPCTSFATLFAISGYMLVVEPLVALISLVFVVPQMILLPIFQHYINKLIAERVTLIRSFSDGVATLPAEQVRFEESDLPRELDGLYENRIRTFFLKFGSKAAINLLNSLAPLSVLLFGGMMVIQGETTIGVVVAFVSGFDRLSMPIRELIAYYREAAQASVQHRMIARWM